MNANHVHLKVRDLGAATDWFRKILAVEPEFANEAMAVLPAGAMRIVLDRADADSPAVIGLASFDCDGDYEAAVSRGAPSIEPPAERPWGARAAYVRGPGAIVVEFEQSRAPLRDVVPEPAALALVSADVARHCRALPLRLDGERLVCAMASRGAAEELEALANRPVVAVSYPESEILEAIAEAYRRPDPAAVSHVEGTEPSLPLEDVLSKMGIASRRAASKAPAYALEGCVMEIETLRADAFLIQGATAMARLYWTRDGVYEEWQGRFYRTSTMPEEMHAGCMRRLRVVAGLAASGSGPGHARFELRFGGRSYLVDAAFAGVEAALLGFTLVR